MATFTKLTCPDCNKKFRTRRKIKYGLCARCTRNRKFLHWLHYQRDQPMTEAEQIAERERAITHRVGC